MDRDSSGALHRFELLKISNLFSDAMKLPVMIGATLTSDVLEDRAQLIKKAHNATFTHFNTFTL